jgi:hypothetical protein
MSWFHIDAAEIGRGSMRVMAGALFATGFEA